MSRVIRAAVAACLCLGALAAPAAAGKPITERFPIDDVAVHLPELSAFCEFDVWRDTTGHITFRRFVDEKGDSVRELNNYALRTRYYSDARSVRVNDVGIDRVTFLPDGNIILVIIGNVQSINAPGQGRVYANVGQETYLLSNGDVELLSSSGQHDPDQFAVLCDVLGAP